MLHTKFHGNRPADSSVDFLRVFTIYGHGGQFGHVTSIISTNFHSQIFIPMYLKADIQIW